MFALSCTKFQMNKYYYDLHIHSCLSPCGDNDMTPNNIAGMASLKGLQIVALTDHNTCKNCPPFLKACKKNGIVGIAGMELTTAEEIHLLCLFEKLDDAMNFSSEVENYIYKIKNKPDIFGEQLILDENDNICGYEEDLLINATMLDLDSAVNLARKYGAFVCPAHIDKQANGIIGILGTFPKEPAFNYAEVSEMTKCEQLINNHSNLVDSSFLCNSDAHYLWDIHEADNYILLHDEPYSSDKIRKELFKQLLQKENDE